MTKEELEEAQRRLNILEKSLKGALTCLHNCPMENMHKQSMQADLEEIAFEVHHLVPVVK